MNIIDKNTEILAPKNGKIPLKEAGHLALNFAIASIVCFIISFMIGFCSMSFVPPESRFDNLPSKFLLGVTATMVIVLVMISITWKNINTFLSELYIA